VAGVSGHDCKLPMCTPTTAVARYQPVLSDVERMTLLGFLAAYRGYTRDAYALDLRQFTAPEVGSISRPHPPPPRDDAVGRCAVLAGEGAQVDQADLDISSQLM
jgi:hypothetical protein